MAETLDYIHRHLTHLGVVDDIPDGLPQHDVLVNRALDVRSSSMLYLAMQLKHDGNRLGVTGLAFLIPIDISTREDIENVFHW